ncbi:IS701 family transposase [Streptomyces otsuchiensis]|uniref:IS701 family transposase n=1 Tax=Streptomyces otsuchiensis TaxID=2681388 RepID=UPI00102F4CBE|nr:transposase [Streptomyces otsuchiensis]
MARVLSTTGAPAAARPSRDRATTGADHPAFGAFVAELFAGLPRADQRRWAHAYTRGLLVTPGRKTTRRIAARVSDSATAAQALHQFVNASPWEWQPVRALLADWVVRRAAPRALVLGATVLPKRGDRSCGVHRRFVPGDGRTVNCQLGLGAFLTGPAAAVPVDWRLLLPGPWSDDPQARSRARIPGDAPGSARSATALALDLVDSAGSLLPAGDVRALPVLADLDGFAEPSALVEGLAARGRFVVRVREDLALLPDRPAAGRSGAGPLPARDLLGAHSSRPHQLPAPTGIAMALVRLPGTPATVRLVGERLPDGALGRLWLTDLTDRPPRELAEAVRLGTATAEAVKQLDDVGLRAFEGRSYPGWHHHMTLVSAALAYRALGHLTPPREAAPPREATSLRWAMPPRDSARGVRRPAADRPPRGGQLRPSPPHTRAATNPARQPAMAMAGQPATTPAGAPAAPRPAPATPRRTGCS